MENLLKILTNDLNLFFNEKYSLKNISYDFQITKKEFEGDITLVVFPLIKYVKKNPLKFSNEIGEYLKKKSKVVANFNIIKGFLNINLTDKFFVNSLIEIYKTKNYGFSKPKNKKIIVEFSSPNTNKPLHLGHVRNNLLGFSISKILEANGYDVIKTQIINDRGIHICKSMIAWKLYGNGSTPKSTGIKGDKFVGKYYVLYEEKFKSQVNELIKSGVTEKEARNTADIFVKAKEMLINWELGDKETFNLWEKMNSWVYDGFNITYKNLEINFDSYYYESKTYLLGKEIIDLGLEKKIFYIKNDNSIWIDLKDEGLDEKLLLRSDGTSVYITQDLGTAVQRKKDYDPIHGMVYTVGNEQDYHFNVLFTILRKLGYKWASNLYHLSYGMVDLPSGKMKSREGIVVDADDIIEEMRLTAREISNNLGKINTFSQEEKNRLFNDIGLGALKYHILKVDPRKKIMFDPKKSIDFQGNTGSFIQYAYARIQSIIRKSETNYNNISDNTKIGHKEKDLIKHLMLFPSIIKQSGEQYNPSMIVNYLFELVKSFNSFYQNVNILGEKDLEQKKIRLILTEIIGLNIKTSCYLLGINVPKRM